MRRSSAKFWTAILLVKSSPRSWMHSTETHISLSVPPSMSLTWVRIRNQTFGSDRKWQRKVDTHPLSFPSPAEWRQGQRGHLTLQDEDLTSRTVGGWKKLNTLAHYGVKDSAIMSLVTRPNDSYSSNNTSICKKSCKHSFDFM